MRLYNGDVVEIINSITPYGNDHFLSDKIGQRIKVSDLYFRTNSEDTDAIMYQFKVIYKTNIIIYKRPLLNRIKALLKIDKV